MHASLIADIPQVVFLQWGDTCKALTPQIADTITGAMFVWGNVSDTIAVEEDYEKEQYFKT